MRTEDSFPRVVCACACDFATWFAVLFLFLFFSILFEMMARQIDYAELCDVPPPYHRPPVQVVCIPVCTVPTKE